MSGEDEFRYVTPERLLSARLGQRDRPQWAAAVVCFRDRKGSGLLIDALPARPAKRKLLYGIEPGDGRLFEADLAGRAVAVVGQCIWGGPQAAILAEELAVLGTPILLGWGACGAIGREIERHCPVVATAALAGDGTTRAYGAEDLSADAALVEAATAAAEPLGFRPRPVTVGTVDALYRETRPLIDELQSRGADVVNMETSPFYAAARAGGARCLWIGYVSDRLDATWEDWHGRRDEANKLGTRWMAALLARVLRGRR